MRSRTSGLEVSEKAVESSLNDLISFNNALTPLVIVTNRIDNLDLLITYTNIAGED